MANKKMRRPKAHENNAYNAVLRKMVESFWFAEGDVFPEVLHSPVKKKRVNDRIAIDTQDMFDALTRFKWNWSIIYMVFCVDEFGKVYPRVSCSRYQNSSRSEIMKECEEDMWALISSLNPKHYVSHGYFSAPSDIDEQAMVEDILEMFERNGAYDRDVVAVAKSMRVKY